MSTKKNKSSLQGEDKPDIHIDDKHDSQVYDEGTPNSKLILPLESMDHSNLTASGNKKNKSSKNKVPNSNQNLIGTLTLNPSHPPLPLEESKDVSEIKDAFALQIGANRMNQFDHENIQVIDHHNPRNEELHINEEGLKAEDDDEEEEEEIKEVNQEVIKLMNVHKTYLLGLEGVPALRGVNLSIKAGEFICVLGTSGGGKTTLLNIIGTIDKPSKGDVYICGLRIKYSTKD